MKIEIRVFFENLSRLKSDNNIGTWFAVCIVVAVLCIVVILCVFVVLCGQCFFFTLDAGLLARSQYSEGPATGHLDTGFSWFPCA